MSAPTLHGRLACACNCAYGIETSGALQTPGTDRYLSGSGLGGTPIGLAGGRERIIACLVGQSSDGVVVAFRGTLPPRLTVAQLEQVMPDYQTVLDWIQDLTAELKRFPWLPSEIPEALIHEGFGNGLETLWTPVEAEIERQLASPGTPARVLFTGHSKGGSLAILAALRWSLKAGAAPATVVTFAAARAGNRAFADLYQSKAFAHVRYEFADDIVPHLPADVGGIIDHLAQIPWAGKKFATLTRYEYESVGILRFIDWTGKIVHDSARVEAKRFRSLASIVARLDLTKIARCHRIACTGADHGYMSAVAPTWVC